MFLLVVKLRWINSLNRGGSAEWPKEIHVIVRQTIQDTEMRGGGNCNGRWLFIFSRWLFRYNHLLRRLLIGWKRKAMIELGLTSLLNIWFHIKTMPVFRSGTLTNMLPHRNAMPQTQDTAPHPVIVYRHRADLTLCYPFIGRHNGMHN